MKKDDRDRLVRLEAGQEELKAAVKRLEGGHSAIEGGQKAVEKRLKALEGGQIALGDRQKSLESGQIALGDRQKSLESGQKTLEDGQKSLKSDLEAKMEGYFKDLYEFLNEMNEKNERRMAVLIEDYDSKRAALGEGIRISRDRLDNHEARIQKLEDGAA
jgi:peptidoglycan hydrolase CwlO-like protein